MKITIAILLIGCMAAFAQSSLRLVNGRVYNILDSSAWRIFGDLEVSSVDPDGGIVCRCFTVQDDSYTQGGSGPITGRYSVVHSSHRVYTETILLVNYESYQALSPGMTIPGPIKAILSDVTTLSSGPNSMTTWRGTMGNENVNHYENLNNYPVYDVGVDYFPPERPLTPQEVEAAAKARIAQDKKTFKWIHCRPIGLKVEG